MQIGIKTYHRLIKVVRRYWETKLIQDERHERSITHMPRNLIGNVHVLQSWDIFNRTQARNGVETAAGRTEEVVENPVIASISVDEAT